MKEIRIGQKSISAYDKPFIIAEMSGNHNKSLDRALQLIEAAAKARVDAIKLQTYTANTITIQSNAPEFQIYDPNSLWQGRTLYNLYEEAHTPWEWHKPIFDYCSQLGLLAFSTPFDDTSVDFLETLGVPCYKIASFENNHLPLIRKVAATKKPVIISTGLASLSELAETVKTIKDAGNDNIILLKCTSSYPASPESTNLLTLPHMRSLFDVQVGLSDHTLGIGTSIASVALGATVIEKHFTLNRADGGVDAAFSLEPSELKMLVEETERAWLSLGNIYYGPTETEKKSLQFRRSIYVIKDLKAGDKITEANIKIIRPGYGLSPKYYDLVLGKTVKTAISSGTPLNFSHLM